MVRHCVHSTFVDEGAENGIETYRLGEDGNIEIEYTFSIDGEFKAIFKQELFNPNQATQNGG